MAAPPDALTLHTWCFPGDGCIGYQGCFDQADAQAEADRLAAQGWRWTCGVRAAYSRWAT